MSSAVYKVCQDGKYEVEVWENGTKRWFLNGKIHREGAPAVMWKNGNVAYFLNGKLHREDGPAFESIDGDKVWYLNGKRLTEQEWRDQLKR